MAVFVIMLQLYLVKTQARTTPLHSSRAIKLPYCHIASFRDLVVYDIWDAHAKPHSAKFWGEPGGQPTDFEDSCRTLFHM